MTDRDIQLFASCPERSIDHYARSPQRMIGLAQRVERTGCAGLLVHTRHMMLDPGLIAHLIVQHTHSLCPVLVIQMEMSPPIEIAKLAYTLAQLHRRRLFLMLTSSGGFSEADSLRMATYATEVKRLLASSIVCIAGKRYQVERLHRPPLLPVGLQPVFLAEVAATDDRATTFVRRAATSWNSTAADSGPAIGKGGQDGPLSSAPEGMMPALRVGLVSREKWPDAWAAADRLFDSDSVSPQTQPQRRLRSQEQCVAAQVLPLTAVAPGMCPSLNHRADPLLLCRNGSTYLVGDHRSVGGWFAAQLARGFRAFIVDAVPTSEDLEQIRHIINGAREITLCNSYSMTG